MMSASISVDKVYNGSWHQLTPVYAGRVIHKRQFSHWYMFNITVHVGRRELLSICCRAPQHPTCLVHLLWTGTPFLNLTIFFKGKGCGWCMAERANEGEERDSLRGLTHGCLPPMIIQKLLLSRTNK